MGSEKDVFFSSNYDNDIFLFVSNFAMSLLKSTYEPVGKTTSPKVLILLKEKNQSNFEAISQLMCILGSRPIAWVAEELV